MFFKKDCGDLISPQSFVIINIESEVKYMSKEKRLTLNAEKRKWIAKLAREGSDQPILVTPIKDSGYFVLENC